MRTELRLKIAGVVIRLRSDDPLDDAMTEVERRFVSEERFEDSVYAGRGRSDIFVDVKVVPKIPRPRAAETIFVTYHDDDGKENWRHSVRRRRK